MSPNCIFTFIQVKDPNTRSKQVYDFWQHLFFLSLEQFLTVYIKGFWLFCQERHVFLLDANTIHTVLLHLWSIVWSVNYASGQIKDSV